MTSKKKEKPAHLDPAGWTEPLWQAKGLSPLAAPTGGLLFLPAVAAMLKHRIIHNESSGQAEN